MALEQIGATRKDPEKMHGVLSGRAMEFLDEESLDLAMQLRSSYGHGALELLRKMSRALEMKGDPSGLDWYWPKFYQPTPGDIGHLVPALVAACTPILEPVAPTQGIAGGAAGGGTGAPKAPVGKSLGSIMDIDDAQTFLRVNLDLDLLTDDDDDPTSDDDTVVDRPIAPRPRRMVAESGGPDQVTPAEEPAVDQT
jgi:hypothetical protein